MILPEGSCHWVVVLQVSLLLLRDTILPAYLWSKSMETKATATTPLTGDPIAATRVHARIKALEVENPISLRGRKVRARPRPR